MTEVSDPEPRKGRSNAILTYELMSEFTERQARTEEMVKTLVEKSSDVNLKVETYHAGLKAIVDKNFENHEARVRAIELANGILTESKKASVSVWVWVYGAVIAFPSFITAIIGLIRLARGN